MAHRKITLPSWDRSGDNIVISISLAVCIRDVGRATEEIERRLSEVGSLRPREGAGVEDADRSDSGIGSHIIRLDTSARLPCHSDAGNVDVGVLSCSGRFGDPVDAVFQHLGVGGAGAAWCAGGDDHYSM